MPVFFTTLGIGSEQIESNGDTIQLYFKNIFPVDATNILTKTIPLADGV